MTNPNVRKLSVVVACFNEEANLKRFPEEVVPILLNSVDAHELIFVDDGSTDTTSAVMEDLRSRFPSVIAVRHDRNRGLGAAIRSGLERAGGDAVLTLDADLTFHPRELPRMLDAFEPGVDCVMGSPFQGTMEGVAAGRKFLSWAVNALYRVLLGRDVSSVSSIFRLYRASSLKKLELACTSFDINAEILFKLLAAGGEVREVPVTLGARIHGRSKINFLREIKNHIRMFARILQWKIKNRK